MPRFVVLAHDWPAPHLDLLIERDGVLRSWRLPAGFDPLVPCRAEANADHRLHYLDYEGPVSDGRGTVSRWDAGEVVWERHDADGFTARLDGRRACGRYELVRQTAGEFVLRRAG